MRSVPRFFNKVFLLFTLISILLASCSMPGIPFSLPSSDENPEPITLPTPTQGQAPQNYAPAIIETMPIVGSTIGVQEEITFYFNQPMDRASVEAAWVANPVGGGEFHWADDATLTFKPNQPLQAGASLTMGVNTGARSSSGIAFSADENFNFKVANSLHPRQYLPEDGSVDISVDSAIIATFDQPVVPLGADPATLPVALALDPPVDGQGEWLNTSTYRFTATPALAGGTTYNVTLNPNLTSTAGTDLTQVAGGLPLAWTFTTARPRLLDISPSTETPLPLDLELTLTFNQGQNESYLGH